MSKKDLPRDIPQIIDRLQMFNERASRLQARSFHKQATQQGNGYRIESRAGECVSTHIGADEESTEAVLLLLRMLMQDRDEIAFAQIVEMHQRLPISDHDKALSKGSLTELARYLATSCSVVFTDWQIVRSELLEVLLYGEYAHLNADKRAKVKRIREHPLAAVFQSDFQHIVLNCIECAIWFRLFNERILRDIGNQR